MGNSMAKPKQVVDAKSQATRQNEKHVAGNGVPGVRKTCSDNTNATANTSGTHGSAGPESAQKDTIATRAFSMRQEEQVSVNLPMTELMGYLQSVANNSSNLPMTRRDDPELGRIVSTLSTEEFAKKSEAFIPSDFRIIAGSFLSYKKVWDLPTSEEYNPVDGVQEPGRSQGGACTNSLLKTLYDAENEPDGETIQYNASSLFKDDDDTTVNTIADSFVFRQNLENFSFSMLSSPQMSWMQLLMEMKAEMVNAGYFQVPMITSSRKLDLNQPFAIAPPDFDPAKNVKRALLIGCNYDAVEGAQIKASHDDVKSIQDYIVNIQGFPQSKDLMTTLIDDGKHKPPTYRNITDAFRSLSESSQPGDVVFVHFSGHGCRVLDSPIDAEVNSYDEAIVPCDFSTAGLLRDTLIFKTLIAPMKKGVTVTCVIDSCDTGIVVDLPYSWKSSNVSRDGSAKMTINDDFSFVRFLKVIKTLYDSSTFTLLGKTVRGVLDEKSPTNTANNNSHRMYDDATVDASFDEDSLVTLGKETDQKNMSSFFGVFSACHASNPSSPTLKPSLTDVSELASLDGRLNPRSQSGGGNLLQHMFNCTLPILDDVDEGQTATQQTRGNDEDYEDSLGTDSFGTDLYSSAYDSKKSRDHRRPVPTRR